MPLCRTWIALGLSALVSAAPAAVIYKWTDADGVVHFSDQPVPGAEKVVTFGGSSRGVMTGSTPAASAPAEKPQKPPSLAFLQIAITSPASGETFTGDQPVNVSLSAEPALSPNQTVAWTLNGAGVSPGSDSTHFTLPDLARGTYTLAATVTDSASGESRSVDPVTFNVVRPSVLSPQHK